MGDPFPEGALAVVLLDGRGQEYQGFQNQIPCKVVGAMNQGKKGVEVEVVVALGEPAISPKDGIPKWTLGNMANKKASEIAVLHTCVPNKASQNSGRVEWKFEDLEVELLKIDELEAVWKSMLPAAGDLDSPNKFDLETACEYMYGKNSFTPQAAWSTWLRVSADRFWTGRPDAILCKRPDLVQDKSQGQTLVMDLDGGAEGERERVRQAESLKQARQRLTKVMLQRNSPLTTVLNDREINQIVSKCSIITVEAGDELVRQGDVGAEMYFVVAGELDSIVEYGQGENALSQVVEKLVPGNTFGEVSLRSHASKCTVRATGHGELGVGSVRTVEMVVNQSVEAVRALEQIIRDEPTPAFELLMKKGALLLELLSDREIKVLSKLFEVRSIDEDQMLYQEGESGNSMFLILRGCARVYNALPSRDGGVHRHQISVLKASDLFEESCVLLEHPRVSSVLVLAGSVIGEVQYAEAAAVLATSKAAEQYQKRMEGCTSLTYVTEACMRDAVSAFFPKLSPEELRSIALGAEQICCDKGFEIVRAGKTSTSIYFVLEGELEVLVAGDTPTGWRQVGLLPVGHTVGEISMISSARATATVVTTQPSNLIKISLDAAEPIILSRPDLVDYIHHLKRIFLERREIMEVLADNLEKILEIYRMEEHGDQRGHAVINKDPPFFARWVADETVEVLEISPPLFGKCPSDRGRYERSDNLLSEGPFKRIYRAFDSEWKMEVAWNVVLLHKMPTSTKMHFLSEVNTLLQLTNDQPTWLRYTLVEDKHGNLRMKNKWELSQANPVKEMLEQFTPRSMPIGEAFGNVGLAEQDLETLTGQEAWRALKPWDQERPTDWDEAIPAKYLSAAQLEQRRIRQTKSRIFAAPSIIKCYNYWEDEATRTMVFITELIHPTRGAGHARRAFTCLQLGSYEAKAPFTPGPPT